MHNERIMIFGDSYSTYEGYIPKGYETYYPHKNIDSIYDVSQTWWKMLLEETSSDIILNNSWSGSTVCNMGYSGDCSKTSSFIFRLQSLIDNGFFENNVIDRIFVFGGTNDSCTGNICGELKFSDWATSELLQILPGYSYFINLLLGVVLKNKVHIIINTELREDVTKGICDICNHYGIAYTLLDCIEKIEGHPTYIGMCEIKNQVIANLK